MAFKREGECSQTKRFKKVLGSSNGNPKGSMLAWTRRAIASVAFFSGFNAITNWWSRCANGPNLTVLAYHRVNNLPHDVDPFTVSPAQFAKQMAYLKRKHFHIITFSEALRLRSASLQRERVIILTFDDGYRDNFVNAVPILNEFGFKACFFVRTDLIGRNAQEDNSSRRLNFPGMTEVDLRALFGKGFEIGAHTRNHSNLLELPLEAARREVIESKLSLEKIVGAPVAYFAYPGGKRGIHYNETLKEMISREFLVCCTTTRGRNSIRKLDFLEIHRICVQRWWSPFYFARELEGTFDFVENLTLRS